MKVWKLVAGILSCVFFLVTVFQSCAAGVADAIVDNGSSSGSAGIILSVLMLASGIVSIATHKSTGKGGNIAILVMCGLAALVGFTNIGIFKDLIIWSSWCAANAILALIAIFVNKKPE